MLFINGRCVECAPLRRALEGVYAALLPKWVAAVAVHGGGKHTVWLEDLVQLPCQACRCAVASHTRMTPRCHLFGFGSHTISRPHSHTNDTAAPPTHPRPPPRPRALPTSPTANRYPTRPFLPQGLQALAVPGPAAAAPPG